MLVGLLSTKFHLGKLHFCKWLSFAIVMYVTQCNHKKFPNICFWTRRVNAILTTSAKNFTHKARMRFEEKFRRFFKKNRSISYTGHKK